MTVKSESEVAQSCPTLSDPMDRSPPGFSFHGIFQARGLEWAAIAFSVMFLGSLQNKVVNWCADDNVPQSRGQTVSQGV